MTNLNPNNGEIEQVVVPERSSLRWLWWLAGLLVLAALIWGLTRAFAHDGAAPTPPPPEPTITAPPTEPAVSPSPTPTETGSPVATASPEPTPTETDWSNYPIIVNGVGITDNFATVGDDQIFPTHVPLEAVATALGAEAFVTVDDAQQVTLDGHKGRIVFMVGDDYVKLDGDQVVQLDAPTTNINGTIYVPLTFWRDAFGVPTANFQGGHIIINDAPGDN